MFENLIGLKVKKITLSMTGVMVTLEDGTVLSGNYIRLPNGDSIYRILDQYQVIHPDYTSTLIPCGEEDSDSGAETNRGRRRIGGGDKINAN